MQARRGRKWITRTFEDYVEGPDVGGEKRVFVRTRGPEPGERDRFVNAPLENAAGRGYMLDDPRVIFRTRGKTLFPDARIGTLPVADFAVN